MADYVRVGPPYGQINYLAGNYFGGWFGIMGSAPGWQPDNWQLGGASGAASAVASFSPTGNAVSGFNTSNIWNLYGDSLDAPADGWLINVATAIPSGQIVAVATIVSIPSPQGAWMWAVAARSPTGANNLWADVALPGGFAPAQGTVGIATMPQGSTNAALWTGQPFQTTSAEQAQASAGIGIVLMLRAANNWASGGQVSIQAMGLYQWPYGTPTSSTDRASFYGAATAGSVWGGLVHGQVANRVMLDSANRGPVARVPFLPFDCVQPAGQAMDIGTYLRPGGGADWGFLQTVMTNSPVGEGNRVAYKDANARTWTAEVVVGETDRNALRRRLVQLQQILNTPGNVMTIAGATAPPAQHTWQAASVLVQYDMLDGDLTYVNDQRYFNAGVAVGNITITTQPWGYRPIWFQGANANSGDTRAHPQGGGGLPFYISGDAAVPVHFSVGQWTGNVLNLGSTPNNQTMQGFYAGITQRPSAPYILSVASNFLSKATGASVPYGLSPVGSQIPFGMATGGPLLVAAAFMPLQDFARMYDRWRVLALISSATGATVPMFLSYGVNNQGGVAVATAYVVAATTKIAYSLPLSLSAGSENPLMALVDFGEINAGYLNPGRSDFYAEVPPLGANATMVFALYTASAMATMAYAGAIDGIIMLPAGPSVSQVFTTPWHQLMPTTSWQGFAITQRFAVNPSYGYAMTFTDQSGGGPTIGYTPDKVVANLNAAQYGGPLVAAPGLNYLYFLPYWTADDSGAARGTRPVYLNIASGPTVYNKIRIDYRPRPWTSW